MKFIEHSTSELICESRVALRVPVGTVIPLLEDSTPCNALACRVRQYEGKNCRVDIVQGDLLNVFDDDKVTTVGVLPLGFFVTRDDDGDWVLVPPAGRTIFSAPGEPLLLTVGNEATKRDAVSASQQYLRKIGEIK